MTASRIISASWLQLRGDAIRTVLSKHIQRFIRSVASGAIAIVLIASPSRAQLVPSGQWHTIETTHFRVHYSGPLESEARRGAINAERAWAELSTELKAPRGKVDLVIADNVDYVQGYATPIPSNRIVIFAHPPIDTPELRNYDDWSRLVITHELTHIFHLDRAEGIWKVGRHVFGRHPALFPNAYQPSWLVEGLAVYYESRITGAGRLEGAEHYMIARAAAEAHQVPRLGEISRATSKFPGGETVYAYGGLLFDYLSRTRGPDKVGKLIDQTSEIILPLSLNARAKRVFGISFENAWRDWRDSVVRVSGASRDPLPGWTQLTHDGRYVESPRWLGDTTIIYSAANGREVTSAYTVSLRGKVQRIGRRNGLGVNVVLPDGSIVFSQPDYIDPFQVRTDLYVQRDGEQRRLTKGARLTQPDVRANGDIVAVQSVPGSTRLVKVSADGRTIVPLTVGDARVQWGDPRWSPDGKSIAALRVRSGGLSEIVIVREGSAETSTLVSERAILATPSWSASGRTIFFSSTRSGTTQAYSIDLPSASTITQVTSASTGAFDPELSPDGRLLAALSFKFDGYHVGVGIPQAQPVAKSVDVQSRRASCANCRLAADVPPPISLEQVPAAKRYSPLQSLAPRYWEPIFGHAPSSGYELGAATSGEDIIGRHAYYVQALYKTKYSETETFAAYQYAGFGQPYLNFTASQEWDHFAVVNNAGDRIGDLARRARIGGMSLSLVRPRARTSATFSIGGDVESRAYSTDPDTLLGRLPDLFGKTRAYPSVFTSASWVNTKRPGLSISREDGVSLSATARQRWESGDISNASRSVVGVVGLFKSLDLPGFSHHVIAARLAGAYADRRAISSFSVGGLSGGSLAVLAGVTVGDDRRTFGVRGFPPSAEQGIRALGGTLEYRAPIAAPSKRVPFIPVLFDRISVSAFGEGGRAFCPASAGDNQICATDRGGPWLASAGAELDFDTALQYDYATRFRLGVAVPVLNRTAGNADAASVYFTVGTSF